ncbi:MAG: hypothetical protein IT308_09115 [Anaerolineaceae bacterium]|nr:hypothetical protein [Anaerolineaceae bacterium]
MNPIPVWSEEVLVKVFESDFAGRWKPASFFRWMTAAALHHADNLGFGYRKMLDDGMIWVLSRLKIYFYRFPVIDERMLLQTWPKGIQRKLFFMRDFVLTDSVGKQCAIATSAWVLIDPQNHRILLPGTLPGSLPENAGRAALDEIPEKINPPEDLPEKFSLEARYSAIDIVGHVNNGQYIDWISDCFSPEEYRARQIAWMQINYSNEVRPGDRVSVRANPSGAFVQGLNLTPGTTAFEAALGWVEED